MRDYEQQAQRDRLVFHTGHRLKQGNVRITDLNNAAKDCQDSGKDAVKAVAIGCSQVSREQGIHAHHLHIPAATKHLAISIAHSLPLHSYCSTANMSSKKLIVLLIKLNATRFLHCKCSHEQAPRASNNKQAMPARKNCRLTIHNFKHIHLWT